ncbi:MAG: GUN4 domain-containing protein, partial [Spirulina sp.]
DNSPAIDDMTQPFPSQPTYTTLRRWMGRRFKKQEKTPLSFGDNLWFFFSGHGKRYRDRDYLLLSDSDSSAEQIEQTAISLDYITKYLCQSGAGNIILFIDACREAAKDGSGLELPHQQGIISIASCSPNELSYEIDDLQNGSFTHVLLESLEIQGERNCATVERLSNRLRTRVKEINRQYKKPIQTPHEVIQPASKYHFILLPDRATLRDVETLKMDAYKAEKEDARLAEKLWTQVLVASPADLDALASLKEIWLNKVKWEQQFKIEELEKSFSQERRSIQDAKAAEIQELQQLHQKQQEELERSHQSQISQLEQQLEEERSQLSGNLETAREQLAEKESIIAKLQGQINQLRERSELEMSSSNTDVGEVELKSEKGIDYTKLRDLLAAGQWKEADKETGRVMCQVANRTEEGWLRVEDIDRFPCEDLRTIDRLWVHYSKGKFGFSVQKKIYQELGGTRKYNEEVWRKFGFSVGWRKGGKWLNYSDLTFDPKNVSHAHLPSVVKREERLNNLEWVVGSLLSRRDL